MKVIVVQCSNGYQYAQLGYDFNPVIEREFKKIKNIVVEPFPYKKLMGVSYQGVYDKKYCQPILDKVDVDFLILTRFDCTSKHFGQEVDSWGYAIRIVDAKNLEQINSIRLKNATEYLQIENHIKANIGKLKRDLENAKN